MRDKKNFPVQSGKLELKLEVRQSSLKKKGVIFLEHPIKDTPGYKPLGLGLRGYTPHHKHG